MVAIEFPADLDESLASAIASKNCWAALCVWCGHQYEQYDQKLESEHFVFRCPNAPQELKEMARERLRRCETDPNADQGPPMAENNAQRKAWVVAGKSRPNSSACRRHAVTEPEMKLDTALDTACQRWLRTRKRFYRDDGMVALEDFAAAEKELLAVFANNWRGDEMLLIDAYEEFRQALWSAVEDRCRPIRTN